MKMTPWPAERAMRLRVLWQDDGLSAAAIGRDLGVSKSAVIGKARRMGLASREHLFGVAMGSRQRERKMGKHNVSEDERRITGMPGFKKFITCEFKPARSCQWLDGAPKDRNFCGAPTRLGRSWCDEHWSRVFIPAKKDAA